MITAPHGYVITDGVDGFWRMTCLVKLWHSWLGMQIQVGVCDYVYPILSISHRETLIAGTGHCGLRVTGARAAEQDQRESNCRDGTAWCARAWNNVKRSVHTVDLLYHKLTPAGHAMLAIATMNHHAPLFLSLATTSG